MRGGVEGARGGRGRRELVHGAVSVKREKRRNMVQAADAALAGAGVPTRPRRGEEGIRCKWRWGRVAVSSGASGAVGACCSFLPHTAVASARAAPSPWHDQSEFCRISCSRGRNMNDPKCTNSGGWRTHHATEHDPPPVARGPPSSSHQSVLLSGLHGHIIESPVSGSGWHHCERGRWVQRPRSETHAVAGHSQEMQPKADHTCPVSETLTTPWNGTRAPAAMASRQQWSRRLDGSPHSPAFVKRNVSSNECIAAKSWRNQSADAPQVRARATGRVTWPAQATRGPGVRPRGRSERAPRRAAPRSASRPAGARGGPGRGGAPRYVPPALSAQRSSRRCCTCSWSSPQGPARAHMVSSSLPPPRVVRDAAWTEGRLRSRDLGGSEAWDSLSPGPSRSMAPMPWRVGAGQRRTTRRPRCAEG